MKRLLIVISISLPLTIWYFLSLAAVRAFLYNNLPSSTGGVIFGGLAGGFGAFNGVLIGALFGILLGTLFTYRKTAHKLQDFTVTLSEEALSIKAPDVSTETIWQNVTQVTNNKHHVQMLIHRPPLLISVISVPKRVFENIADTGGSTAITCNDGFWTCLKLHGGGTLFYGTYSFAGTATTNAIWFYIDPDGVYSGTTNGPGKAEQVYIYYKGKISTRGYISSNTCDSHGCDNPIPSAEASWFSW